MAIDRQQLIQRVQEIEGLSDDERAGLLQLLREQKKYGIVWEDKPEEAEQQLASELPVLREVKERFIAGATPDAPNHILIEGDNLHALTALSYTHEGKIDVIYIDPPYNTGNKDFVYNDSYVDREDGYRHSKWLSFMNKRLKIAKRLLSDRGVIFISIGDDEVAQLKLLCEEQFSVIALVPRIAKKGSDQGTHFRPTKDYIIVLANDITNVEPFHDNSLIKESKDYKLQDPISLRKFRKGHSFYQASLDPLRGCVNQRYYMEAPDGTLIIPPGNTFPSIAADGEKIAPQSKADKVWRWSQDSYKQKKHLIYFDKSPKSPLIDSNGNHTDWNAYEKKFEDEEICIDDSPLPNDVIYDYINSLGTTILNSMGISFSFSKPVELVRYLIDITNMDSNITILDFFAGSGTTLHATMKLNAEDGGRRQCILVTNNENGICENVTYERNRRVIQGYTTPKGVEVEGLADNSLRYYRTDFVPNETTIRNKRLLMELSTDMLCIKNNLYCEQDEFAGRKLNKQKMRFFTAKASSKGEKVIEGASMLVVYDEQVVDTLAGVLAELEVKQRILIYVFSNTSYPHTDNFEEVLSKVDLCALPSAILNAYRKITRR